MAKVAAPGTLPSNSLQMGGGSHKLGLTVKRKTPSELRGEQLKQTKVIELVDESPAPLLGSTSNNTGVGNGPKKTELLRNPRFVDTRMDEVYPVKKSRFRMLSGKENTKFMHKQENNSKELLSSLKNLSVFSDIAAKKSDQHSLGNCVASAEASKDDVVHTRQTIEKCSQSTFRSVTELSLGGEKSFGLATVDMDKALKGLVACEPAPDLPSDSSERLGDPSSTYSGNFRAEFHIPGQKAPLDFTLKTYMRVVSSSSVNWIHRSIMSGGYNGLPQFTFHSGCVDDSSSSGITLASQILSSKALHSWVYPQSSLPPSLISVLTSAATEGVEMDFLRKRQQSWEESFRSLYYMHRKKVCNIFYVCTSYFVVMFIGSDGLGTNHSYYAYISQSTRGLRQSLKEHDVCFSMPLCRSKVEQATMEDLVELSEIEKHNLGQTRRSSSFSDIDNTPQSLLAFSDNGNVHALYDFLLNYRSFLTFLTASDVPMLYSPVPFRNAALSAPEVSCMEMKRSDHIAALPKGSITKNGETTQSLSPGSCCSIEIKDAYLPPWIICNVCSLIGSEGGNFETSFTTERTSVGLNVALKAVCNKSDAQTTDDKGLQATIPDFGIPEAVVTPHLLSGFLKGLERCNGSYTASLSPV